MGRIDGAPGALRCVRGCPPIWVVDAAEIAVVGVCDAEGGREQVEKISSETTPK